MTKNRFKPGMAIKAISDTLLAMGFNPELVEEYLTLAGEADFAQNRNRQTAAWVTRASFLGLAKKDYASL